MIRWWQALIGVWMAVVIVAAFNWIPPAMGLGETSRIAWFHIPVAWICVLAFTVAMVCSIGYLRRRDMKWDDRAAAAAEIGLVFAILATVSGSMWAQKAWGVFWNWDPRESSIIILLLIYGAYFALRAALEDPERRAALAGAYNIVAFVTMPYLIFVVPRIMRSLHPDPIINTSGEGGMDTDMVLVLNASLIGMTMIFAWMHTLATRIRRRTREALDG
jgi:heme exporter protein C